MPRFRSSFRITRARGQPSVLDRSETEKAEGSSLLPEPMALMSGTPRAWQRTASSSLAETVSTASTT